uniref:non-specific serine/threonine protein kinase n=1 Tax=Ditylenchus dipsaci TaxID=166011 RepID=A0A915D956_9BILA
MEDCSMDSGESSSMMLKRSTNNSNKERRMRLEKVGSYRVGKTLGRGNFASVRIAYHEVANTKVAMKIVDRRTLDAENLVKIEREVEILQNLSHPSVVKLYEVIRTEKHIYIITEYISNGELFDMLMDKGRQTEDESLHRDLKAENLLLDRKGNIKLIDFGFSNYQKNGCLLSTWCGSPPYAAPELLLAQEYDGRLSDVWSLGVILYILVTAGFPFPGDSVDKLKRAVLGDHLKIPFWVSVECADLIRKMLTVSPAKRCSLSNVIQHRWFACKVPDQIKDLLHNLPNITPILQANHTLSAKASTPVQLDPTVMLFMQQHTGWTEDQISEEVLARNYESPIFAAYELLHSKLDEFKDSGTLQLENDQARRDHLNLSTSPDYESEDSSASDIANEDTSPRYAHIPRSSGTYKARRRGYRRSEQGPSAADDRRHTLCASERNPVNPLLSAAAQQFAVDTTRAWANAAAAAAMQLQFASQLQQTHQQQLQQAALNLVSLQNFPFDYARMMHVPNQERRASANEALLGLNGYAHLLAACSTMEYQLAVGSQQPRRSVEEEGEHYLNQRGNSKRNTVSGMATASNSVYPTSSSLQRHIRTPYSKNGGGIAALGGERRSSWASPTPASTATGLNISAQQQAQLERIYRQSIGSTGVPGTSNPSSNPNESTPLSGVQQLQLEFQKLCASTTKDSSPVPPSAYGSAINSLLLDNQMKAPIISITDENNQSLPPSSSSYDPLSFHLPPSNTLKQQQSEGSQFSSTSNHQPRPATVIGFSPAAATSSSTASTPTDPSCSSGVLSIGSSSQLKPRQQPAAMSSLCMCHHSQVRCEVQADHRDEESVRIRIAPDELTILELTLFRMPQSPNISKAVFTLVQGNTTGFEQLKSVLLSLFNEVY